MKKVKKAFRINIDKTLIETLENTYGEIIYKAEDFKGNDNIYYIYVDLSLKNSVDGSENPDRIFNDPPIYIGCILEVDNKFYYGNKTNLLSDVASVEISKLVNK